jgi:hypothetical protein
VVNKVGVRAAVVILAAVLLVGCSEQVRDAKSPVQPGPLEKGHQHAWATKAAVGKTFTDGMEVLTFRGQQSAVIKNVEFVGDAGLKLIGVKLAGPDRSIGAIQYIDAWPPRDPQLKVSSVMPAFGQELKPKGQGSYELLLGIEVTQKGYLVRKGIKVEYTTADGKEYTQFIPAVLAVCSSEEWLAKKRNCPLPEGWADFPESLGDA